MTPRPTLRAVWVPAAVVVLACVDLAVRHSPDGAPGSSPREVRKEVPLAGPDVIALLDGLTVGDVLGDSQVERIHAPHERQVRIVLHRAGRSWSLWVALRDGDAGPHAPRETVRYALFYENIEVEPAVLTATLDALAARLERTEQGVPVPAGL